MSLFFLSIPSWQGIHRWAYGGVMLLLFVLPVAYWVSVTHMTQELGELVGLSQPVQEIELSNAGLLDNVKEGRARVMLTPDEQARVVQLMVHAEASPTERLEQKLKTQQLTPQQIASLVALSLLPLVYHVGYLVFLRRASSVS